MTKQELIDHLQHLEQYTHYSEDAPALREVIEMLMETHGNARKTHACDLIDRREAIDAICDNCDAVKASCPHYPCSRYTAIEKLPSAQPEQNCVLTVWGECSYAETGCSDCEIKARVTKALLPSVHTEIILCKDCRHYKFADNRAFGFPVKRCEWTGFEDIDDDDFCSRAERREDG